MDNKSFRDVQWSGRGDNDTPPHRTKVKENVELYLSSPSVLSWRVIVRNLFYILLLLAVVLVLVVVVIVILVVGVAAAI
jgi:cell division septal protein FtsQ